MASMFESATRVAIEEILSKHAKQSKFGLILTTESARDLTNDIYDLLMTSRNLKSAGDRLIKAGFAPSLRGVTQRD
jgi:hypothetical protein